MSLHRKQSQALCTGADYLPEFAERQMIDWDSRATIAADRWYSISDYWSWTEPSRVVYNTSRRGKAEGRSNEKLSRTISRVAVSYPFHITQLLQVN
jgi:hypothetical protein